MHSHAVWPLHLAERLGEALSLQPVSETHFFSRLSAKPQKGGPHPVPPLRGAQGVLFLSQAVSL